jgi:hypothetical protein
MPEIKNAFLKGKMNKDLDERLVPNGEYRDALNVDVDYSSSSDVGALKNILGNTIIDSINLSSATCIGSVADTENNKIYWLITSATKDVIAEYDQLSAAVSPVIVDLGSILNFNSLKLTTGINILDGILYFTDNLNEPKQVDVAYWKTQTTDFNTGTTGLSEERITVIKKSPLKAPGLTMSSSTRGGNGTIGNTAITVNLDLSKTSSGGVLEAPLDAGVSRSGVFSAVTAYEAGDIILLKHNFTEPNSGNVIKIEARILLAANYVSNATSFTAEILTISETVPGGAVQFQALLEEDDPLFELKFPLFSYRYKYTNGQYSCFAPFSKAAFLPDPNKIGDNFEYDSKNGYNLAMTNSLRSLTITDLNHNINDDVKEIDVLYKDSVNSNVYIVDTLKGVSLPTTFTIKDEQIFKTVDSNQLLRLFDSVPKKAKSQEISANRIIYGNYTHQFDLPTANPIFDIKIKNRYTATSADKNELLSLKSNRTYQIGVVYIDTYGRQTPVLTDKSGVVKVGFNQSKNKTNFEIKLTGALPAGFTSYKYFVKEISSTTHNLCADSFYKDDEGAVYISFPSSEINKIKEDDIITLKKKTGNEVSEIDTKFKVLDKLTTVPKFLGFPFRPTYVPGYFHFGRQFDLDSPGPSGVPSTASEIINYNEASIGGRAYLMEPGATPVPNHNTIIIRSMFVQGDLQIADADETYNSNDIGVSRQAIDAIIPGKKVRFTAGDSKTKIYTVESILVSTEGHDDVEVTFEEEFGDDVLILYDGESYNSYPNSAALATGINIEVVDYKDESSKPEFDGKFFIKLQAESNLLNELVDTTNSNNLNAIGTISFDGVDDGGGANHHRQLHNRYGGKKDINSSMSQSTSLSPYLGGFNDTFNTFVPTPDLTQGYHFVLETEKEWEHGVSNYGTVPFLNGLKEGNYIRFSGWNGNTNTRWFDQKYYKIEKIFISKWTGSQAARLFFIKLSENLDYDLTFKRPASASEPQGRGYTYATTFDFEGGRSTNIANPPIFEVEPKDDIDVDLYYETQEIFTASEHGSPNDLKYHNCYSFGNGVESFIIRDDFNAPVLGKGVRVSTVFEDNYQEEILKSGIIYSQVYNGKNSINRLNQFIIADKITKDLNPEYGSIQKLYGRDTDLLAFCEDKVVKILANKDAIFNADGNPQLIASNRVLGQAIIPATFGSYGISKNPESFIEFTYRSYFVDKNRGCVLRLSADGITEVSNYGMKDYFRDNLSVQSSKIYGTYDSTKGQYNLSLPTTANTTLSFSESINGWVSRKSFIPEGGLSLNNKYYTFYQGHLYEHHNGATNTFYGTKTDSEVTFLLNEAPANVKNFRTLNYEGDSGWYCDSIITNKQDGQISTFIEKEGKYFNYISGIEENENTIDTKAFNVQGIGYLTSQTLTGVNRIFSFNFELNKEIQINDKLYYVDASSVKQDLGNINAIDIVNKTVSVVNGNKTPQSNAYMFFAKNAKFNTSGVLGYYATVKMKNQATTPKELYSVGSEISISS